MNSKRVVVTLLVAAVGILALVLVDLPSEPVELEAVFENGNPVSAKEATSHPTEDWQAISTTYAQALSQIPERWMERYPEGRVVEQRSFAVGSSNRVWRESLLRTGSDRIPWVVWREKFWDDQQGGGLKWVGNAAFTGNTILVELNESKVDDAAVELWAIENGLNIERELRVANYVTFAWRDLSLGKAEQVLEAFQRAFPELHAEQEGVSFPSAEPSDWSSQRMWGLDTIGALDAWEFETGIGGEDVVVAIIDTGLQRSHPDILDNLFINTADSTADGSDNNPVDDRSGWDFVDDDSDPNDEDGHGTHVSGIAGARGNNGQGAVGVSWGVKILPLKVGDESGLRTSAIVDALAYVSTLHDAGVNIVATNNSYGSGSASSATRSEIEKHNERGILFVAAAGNDGKNMDLSVDSLEFPAGYTVENIISVANSNQENGLTGSSNYGTTSVDISAPGAEIFSMYPQNGYEYLSGTSMSSPMVAGAVALLSQAEPSLNAAQLKQRILDTGRTFESQSGRTLTGKRLDLLAALKPELAGHELEVVSVEEDLVLIDAPGTPVEFELDYLEGATLTANFLEGAARATLDEVDEGVFLFKGTADGLVRLRFESSRDGITRTVEKQIVIGEASDVVNGLIHRFDFEGEGSSEVDLAGSGSATISGANRSSTIFGSSLQLDSSAENMTFQGTFSNEVTIAALVRAEDLVASAHPRILNMPYYYLYFSSGEGPGVPDGNRQTLKFFSNFTSFGVWNAPPKSIQESEWYYVVGSYDSGDIENVPQLFINGAEQVVRLQQEPAGSIVSTGGLSYVGNSEAGDRRFDGLIADLRVYDRRLSSSEVALLGASLVSDRWSKVKIVGPELVQFASATDYEIEDATTGGSPLLVEWGIESENAYELLDSTGSQLSVRFNDIGEYRIVGRASDGMVAHYFSKQISAVASEVVAGLYRGETSGGGIVWLQVDESQESGYVTILDPETSFYRFNVPVAIDENGVFESEELSIGQVVGSVLGILDGEVVGYDVSFSGELISDTNNEPAYLGSFVGGMVNRGGEAVALEVLENGYVSLWREGAAADVAVGSMEPNGDLSLVSGLGESIELVYDEASDRLRGQWGEGTVFLKREVDGTDAELRAGAFGGFPRGVGALGVYAAWTTGDEVDGESYPMLETRFSARGTSTEAPLGRLIALDVEGGVLRLDGADSALEIPAAVAVHLQSGDLQPGPHAVDRFAAQVPVSQGGGGFIAFAVAGDEPLEVLIRALGPAYAESGTADPVLALFQISEGSAISLFQNDDWREAALFTEEGELSQGAFLKLAEGLAELNLEALDDLAPDAAARIWLEAGIYVAVLFSNEAVSGSGLLEVLSF